MVKKIFSYKVNQAGATSQKDPTESLLPCNRYSYPMNQLFPQQFLGEDNIRFQIIGIGAGNTSNTRTGQGMSIPFYTSLTPYDSFFQGEKN